MRITIRAQGSLQLRFLFVSLAIKHRGIGLSRIKRSFQHGASDLPNLRRILVCVRWIRGEVLGTLERLCPFVDRSKIKTLREGRVSGRSRPQKPKVVSRKVGKWKVATDKLHYKHQFRLLTYDFTWPPSATVQTQSVRLPRFTCSP